MGFQLGSPLVPRSIGHRWKTRNMPWELGSTEVQLDKRALGEIHYHIGNTWWWENVNITFFICILLTVTLVRIESLRIWTEVTCKRDFSVHATLQKPGKVCGDGIALTKRGGLQANRSMRRGRSRWGDLALPIAAAPHQLWFYLNPLKYVPSINLTNLTGLLWPPATFFCNPVAFKSGGEPV